MTSVDEEREMNAEERSRAKRSIGPVRDDMGAIAIYYVEVLQYVMRSGRPD